MKIFLFCYVLVKCNWDFFFHMCKCTLGFAHMQRDESIVRTTNTKGFPVKESGAVIHSNLFSDWVHEGVLSLWHWQYFCVFETHTHSHIYCTRHTVWQAVGDPAVREKQTGGRWNSKIPLEYSVQLIYYYSLRLKSKQKDTYWIFLSIVTTDIRSGCMGSTYGNSRMRIFYFIHMTTYYSLPITVLDTLGETGNIYDHAAPPNRTKEKWYIWPL